MITTSDAWKNTHRERLLPESDIEITYSVSEPGVSDHATCAATDEASFSKAVDLISGSVADPFKYGTLEWNFWGLDGSYRTITQSPGYVTEVQSDDHGVFGDVPTVTVVFDSLRTQLLPGITITWSQVFDEWATRFRVTVYNGSTLIKQTTIENNTSVVSRISMDFKDYDKITLEVFEWCLPRRRLRVQSLFLGIQNVYNKTDLLNYQHTQVADLLSATLPKNEISFTLRNNDERWNPDNPTGAEKYLAEQQELVVRYAQNVEGGTEWIEAGRFWLNEWDTPTNGLEASFKARDVLGFMNAIYTGRMSGTLYDIAVDAFIQADLPNRTDGGSHYVVPTILKNYSVNFSGEYTLAEIIQMVAHAGCCAIKLNRDGRVVLEELDLTETDYLVDENVCYTYPEYSLTKPLKAVSVSYGETGKRVETVGVSGEVQTVDNPLIQTDAVALKVAQNTANMLKGRKTLSGEYRADPRLDALDVITVRSKYAENIVAITEITLSTSGGAFRGSYTGRVIE